MNETLITLCQNLVRRRSYSGEEGGVVQEAREFWQSRGLDDFHVDSYGNCIAVVTGSRPGPTMLFDSHIDTVPAVKEQWSVDPWGGDINDGKIYGRGTSDMKGAFAAMLWAAAQYSRETGGDFAGKICVSGVVHEECFEGVSARKISQVFEPDVVIIGEASSLNLKIGQRGRAEILVETFGRNAHSANPEKGRNAVYDMSSLISRIRTLNTAEQRELGKGILELTDIKSSPYPGASVVPDYCRATFDRRLLVDETPDSVLKPLKDLVDDMKRQDPEFRAEVSLSKGKESCYTGEPIEGERFFPGWYYPECSDFVVKALKGLRRRDSIPISPPIRSAPTAATMPARPRYPP